MNKISNIYVGNASLMPSTGGGLININDYLKNPVRIEDMEWSDSMFNNKLVFGDIICNTARYTGYIGKYYASGYTHVGYALAPSINPNSCTIYWPLIGKNSDGAYTQFETLSISKDKEKNTKCRIYVGDYPDNFPCI